MQVFVRFSCISIKLYTYKETNGGVTSRFDSFISHSIEYIEIVQSLKGFLLMALHSKVMTVLLNFRPIPRYLPKNQIVEFRSEILPIDRSKDPLNILKVSVKKNVLFSRY